MGIRLGVVFYLGAQLVGHRPDDPERYRRDAIQLMREMLPTVEGATLDGDGEFDEDAFVAALTGVNLQRSFEAVQAALVDGVKLDRIITTLVLLAADRMANTPVNVDAGWENLTMELNLAASLRSAQQVGGTLVAAERCFPRCVANFCGSLDKHSLASSQRTLERRKVRCRECGGGTQGYY